MRKRTLAKRYARALVDIGKEDGAYERYGNELRDIVGVFSSNPALYRVLMNPVYGLGERQALTGKICSTLGISPIVKKTIALLVERRDIAIIADMAEAYSAMEDDIAGRVRAEVELPFDPTPGLLQAIKDRIKQETRRDALLSVKKNPALIGGAVIRIGNVILDGSVRGQLERMREKLLEGAI